MRSMASCGMASAVERRLGGLHVRGDGLGVAIDPVRAPGGSHSPRPRTAAGGLRLAAALAAGHGDGAPAHVGAVLDVIERGIDVRADRLVGILDGDGGIEDRLERLPDIQALRLPADEHRHRRHLGGRLLGRILTAATLAASAAFASSRARVRASTFGSAAALAASSCACASATLASALVLASCGALDCGRVGVGVGAGGGKRVLGALQLRLGPLLGALRQTLGLGEARRLGRDPGGNRPRLLRLPGGGFHLRRLGGGDRLQRHRGAAAGWWAAARCRRATPSRIGWSCPVAMLAGWRATPRRRAAAA